MDFKVELKGFDKLRASLRPDVYTKAVTRSINRAANSAFVAGSKEIRKSYNLTRQGIKKETEIIHATWKKQYALINIVSKDRTSLKRFGAVQRKKGVYFRIKKKQKRSFIRTAFISQALGGHVFKRLTKKRTPIIKLKADISVAELFQYEPIYKVVVARAQEVLQKEFSRNWDFYVKRAK